MTIQNKTSHHLIKLFTQDEYDNLYTLPHFTDEERSYFFTLSLRDQKLIDSCAGLTHKLYCILSIGYFRAKQNLIDFTFEEIADDCSYILEHYFGGAKAPIHFPTKNTQIRIQNKILKHEQFVR